MTSVITVALSFVVRLSRDWVRRGAGAGGLAALAAHQRANSLTSDDAQDRALVLGAEDDQRHVVLHAQREGRRIGDLQALLQRVGEGEGVVLGGGRVLLGVGAVDAVHALLGHEDHLAVCLQRPLCRHGVGREERHAGAGAEDHDAALLEVPHRTTRDVRLGDLAHRDGGLHARLDALLLQEVLEGEAVHHGAQHAHVVGAAAVHAALLHLRAAEEVASADHDADAHTLAHHGRDLLGHLGDDVGVDAHLTAAEHLAGELDEDTLVGRHFDPFTRRVGREKPTRPGVGGRTRTRSWRRRTRPEMPQGPYAGGVRPLSGSGEPWLRRRPRSGRTASRSCRRRRGRP